MIIPISLWTYDIHKKDLILITGKSDKAGRRARFFEKRRRLRKER